ncbi:hypothetical protein FHT00_000280 [Sphingomonas insulae]|uniref:hypothetical protein n=1 Tax=Sphingomonas insulae TaxID=424800 RepID=UPI0013D6C260|nr:hypothetical protein [Sphingomonas insulae]NIJ28352.1 hypothetical protein [Sphingomonas insulae]
MSRGPGLYWIVSSLSLFGTLFPDLLAHGFLDDRRIVRWIAIPMLIASTTLLVSFYTRWF